MCSTYQIHLLTWVLQTKPDCWKELPTFFSSRTESEIFCFKNVYCTKQCNIIMSNIPQNIMIYSVFMLKQLPQSQCWRLQCRCWRFHPQLDSPYLGISTGSLVSSAAARICPVPRRSSWYDTTRYICHTTAPRGPPLRWSYKCCMGSRPRSPFVCISSYSNPETNIIMVKTDVKHNRVSIVPDMFPYHGLY